jgi:hypothetical protein
VGLRHPRYIPFMPTPNRRRSEDPRRDSMTRAMVSCKMKLVEAEKLPDGPKKTAAQNAAVTLLSKDSPASRERRKASGPTKDTGW